MRYGEGEGCRLRVGMCVSFNESLGSGCDEERVAVVQVHLLNACDDALPATVSVCEPLTGEATPCPQPLPHVVQDKLELRNRDGPPCRVGNHTPNDSYV